MAEAFDASAEENRAEEIDGSFVPVQRDGVTTVELDGEAVVLAEGSGIPVYLDRIGTIVWGTFDGSASLDELAADLAEAFDADVEVVRGDVLGLTKQLGRSGLLRGIAYEPPHEHVRAGEMPGSFAIGEPLPELRAPDLEGRQVALSDLRGRRVLLVNWSPRCGFCLMIAPELSEHQAALEADGIEMVFLTLGEVEENRAVLEEYGLRPIVLLVDPAENEVFPGTGTPCAYIVDEEGRAASSLALGADKVPSLIGRMLGREETEPRG